MENDCSRVKDGTGCECSTITTNNSFPLTDFKVGQKLIIAGFDGCVMSKRLCNMGVGCGAEIEVLRNDSTGPLIIYTRRIRLAIGRGMASKILCRQVED